MEDETSIRSAAQRGDLSEAASLAILLYGREVLEFLRAVHRQHANADDAFALMTERLWKTMSAFRWECSMRTWMYLLARRASTAVGRDVARARRHEDDHGVADVVAGARTETLSLFRTEKRTAFAEMCLELPEDDRELLVLRVTRDLAWRDVAIVLGSQTDLTDEQDLKREAARLRKRYQLVRTRLRELGRKRGILT